MADTGAAGDQPRPNQPSHSRRLAAAVVDWALVGFAVYVYGWVVLASWQAEDESAALLGGALVIAAYYAGLTWLVGGTPGKLLVGIEVVRADGNWPGLARSIVRFVVWAALPVISWAVVLGQGRRGLHDLVADTFVVQAPRST